MHLTRCAPGNVQRTVAERISKVKADDGRERYHPSRMWSDARVRLAHRAEFITAPLFVAAGLWVAHPLGIAGVVACLFGFFVAWPLAEWWLHKDLMHRILRRAHWHHHTHPLDDPPVPPFMPDVALAAIFAVLVAIGGWRVGGSLFAGFALGYGVYFYAHWCIHLGWWPMRGWFGDVVRRHDVHHSDIEANFNVLFPLGDWLFGTLVAPTASKSSHEDPAS